MERALIAASPERQATANFVPGEGRSDISACIKEPGHIRSMELLSALEGLFYSVLNCKMRRLYLGYADANAANAT